MAGEIATRIAGYFDRSPYGYSAMLSSIVMAGVLFYSSSVPLTDPTEPYEQLEFVNIDEVSAPMRVFKKDFSEDGEITDAQPDRAEGSKDNPLDADFAPNLVPPKIVKAGKKLFPQIAEKENIEAIGQIELVIDPNGRVVSIGRIFIRLKKKVPGLLAKELKAAFKRDARRMASKWRFSPSIVNGKAVYLKMTQPLDFTL